MKIRILFFLVILILASCSFNKLFLYPIKLQKNNKIKIIQIINNDTIFLDFDLQTLQPLFINNKNDTIKQDFSIESVIFKSLNGNNLNGWFLKPKSINISNTIIYFNGNSGCIQQNYLQMIPLLKYGFQVFVFDYSGFGFSEGKATRDNILIDGNSALTYLKNREDVKYTKLVIYGQSIGANLAAVVAQKRQAEIDGLVIEGAFSTHKEIAAKSSGFLGRIFVTEKYSAYNSISSFRKPILIIHSLEDKIVPFEMGKKLYEKSNIPKYFYEIEKCHICGTRYYADSISLKIINMLK